MPGLDLQRLRRGRRGRTVNRRPMGRSRGMTMRRASTPWGRVVSGTPARQLPVHTPGGLKRTAEHVLTRDVRAWVKGREPGRRTFT